MYKDKGDDGNEYGRAVRPERAGGGVKPGAGRGPKILPEPPTESEGHGYVTQALVGSAGYARYSARVSSGTRQAVRGCEAPGKRGGTARV